MVDNPVLGDYNGIRRVASQLSAAGDAFEEIGNDLKRVDLTDNWEGQAFTAFKNAYLDSAPGHWLDAADSFKEVSGIMTDYASTLEAHHNAAQQCVDQIHFFQDDTALWENLHRIENQAKADAAGAGEKIAQQTAGALPPRGTPSHAGRNFDEWMIKGMKNMGKVGTSVGNDLEEVVEGAEGGIENAAEQGMRELGKSLGL